MSGTRWRRFVWALVVCCGAALPACGGQAATNPQNAAADLSQQGIYLVFPFENVGSSPRLDWLGEGLEELTIQRLTAAGQQVYTHSGRTSELDRSGLPPSAKLSHASMLRIAQDMDADFVIFGKFTSDGQSLTVDAQVLRVSPTRLLPAVQETGALDSLMDLHLRLLWRLLSANDHVYARSLAEFSKAQRPLRLDAFEHYIRGIQASDDEQRLRDLREAARLEPEWPAPDFAIGDAYYARRDCDSALAWYAKVPKTNDRYAEALFATGVCKLLMNQPDRAEEVFTSLQEALRSNMVSGADLPEILNNLALALARQGKTAAAITDLRRAEELDPDTSDYPFNLGLLAFSTKDFAGAADYFREAAGREPDNAENRAWVILSLDKADRKTEADQERDSAAETFGPDGLPTVSLDAKGDSLTRLERVRRELDTTVLRELVAGSGGAASGQAATAAATAETPAAHVRRGRQELSAGRVAEAEAEFRAALAGDANSASAHNGLADVYLRRSNLEEASKEMQASLQIRDSAVVHTNLARVYLALKKPDLARAEVERALKLAPKYADAKELLDRLQKVKSPGGAQ
ncbi:MAG TPA: tetratricopeptide repeat protein [Candidatus Methylomirabilis sp.]|nr:tetratricopeptide repeat protein [Candidatus Methylomirabilis sp.]